jgi:hypothetical protein
MMIKINFTKLVSFSFAVVLLFGNCRKRADISLPDNLVVFTASEQGISESENAIDVNLKLSRGTDRDIPVTINLTPDGLTYGTDFTTTPAAVAGVITLTVPSGNDEADFTVTKVPGSLFDGDETITFDIYRSEAPVLIGSKKEFKLEFKELVAANSTAKLDGGGVTFPNKVFIDLSANRQTVVLRTNWDMGFYTDPADFKVIMNSSTAMMAKQIGKNDLTQVTAADTVGFYADVAYSSFAPTPSQLAYFDYPNGDMSRTAFGLVAANSADNKVFIVNRGNGVGTPAPGRGWKKVRVLRNASGGYTVQHADIASAIFTTIEVSKDDAYFFKYISFDNGVLPVEPQKTKWDIAWTYFGNTTNFGGEVPYLFQDMIIQNRNVQVAKVLEATKAYNNFIEADLANIPAGDWSTAQNKIGADWRRTSSAPVTAYDDRYYILKDGNNNYYKLKFTSLTDGGVRGYPSIAYALVKRG